MKRTQRKDLFRNIKTTLVSFISITIFVALGVGIYLGIDWSGNDIKTSLDEAYKDGNMHDLSIFFPYGIDDLDIEVLKEIEGVDEIEGQYYAFEFFKKNDELKQAKIIGITENIDKINCIEGRLPILANEVVIEQTSSINLGLKVGDHITLNNENAATSYLLTQIKENPNLNYEDIQDLDSKEYCYLEEEELTITGICVATEYYNTSAASFGISINNSLQVDGIFYTNYENFNKKVVSGYNNVVIKSNELRELHVFSDEYKEKVEEFKEKVKEKADLIGKASYEKVKGNSQEILDIISGKLLKSWDEIESAETSIINGEREIAKAKIEIADNEKLLADSKVALDSGKAEIEQGEIDLNNAKKEIASAKEEYESNRKLYLETKDAYDKAYSEVTGKLKKINTNINYGLWIEKRIYISTELRNDLDTVFSDNNINALFNFEGAEELYSAALKLKKAYEEAELSDLASLDIIQSAVNELIDNENTLLNISKEGYDQIVKDTEKKLNDAEDEISKYEKEIAKSTTLLSDGKKEYKEKLALYESGLKELAEGKEKLEKGIAELEEAKIKVKEAKALYKESEGKFTEFEEKSSETKEYETSVLTKRDNVAYIYVKLLSDIIINLKYCMGGLFLILGIFICYSVITRIISEQKVLIGTKKAFGFKDKEITRTYLAYNGLAAIIGSIAGYIFALYAVEPVITSNSTSTYLFKCQYDYVSVKLLLALVAIEFVLVELVTYLGCKRVLREDAVTLLRGPETPKGKKRWYENLFIFRRLSVYKKTIINNLVNNRKRVFATIVGIAGCTALLITCITLKNNVLESFQTQYKEYYFFDNYIYYDRQIDTAADEIEEVLKNNNVPYTKVYRSNGYSSSEDFDKLLTSLVVYDDVDSFKNLIKLRSVSSEDFNYKGIWLPESIKRHYKLDDNIEINYDSFAGEKIQAKLNGFYKLYTYNLSCYMDKETYEKISSEEYVANSFIIDARNVDIDKLKSELIGINGYTQMKDYYKDDREDAEAFELIAKAMLMVYLSASIVMAVFVILNLLLTFVSEKKRQLIILMINGFSFRNTKRYITFDTTILTIVGIIIGLLIGVQIGDLAVSSFEGEYLYLVHGPNVIAIAIAILVTSFLTIMMTRIAVKKVKKFELIDIDRM